MDEKSGENEKDEDMEDVKVLEGVLKALNENVPPLINSVLGPLLDFVKNIEGNPVERGKAIAAVYKELKSAGMSDEMIQKVLEEQFPSALKLISDIFSGLTLGMKRGTISNDEKQDVRSSVEEAVRKAVSEALSNKVKDENSKGKAPDRGSATRG